MLCVFNKESDYTPENFKLVLDSLGIDNMFFGGHLLWFMSKDKQLELEKAIDPLDTGWIDPENLWSELRINTSVN
jgi:hypothetical protein